ncbi:hypothetical protein BBJ28_00004091 [Nothophytophthora sp. Chile5]|nr:hypothetical protein BBJ28_00004091 [Nothophytophthora sp. Chile5]
MSAMKVAAEEGTITMEVQQHALQKVKNQLFKAVDIRNVRGLSLFFGLGEEKPFNMPGRDETDGHLGLFLISVYSLLNPFFLFVLICLAGFWLYMSSATANETPENPTKIMGRTVTPDQRKLGMLGALAISHAILRDCPTIREEDELGFLSDEADQIADSV